MADLQLGRSPSTGQMFVKLPGGRVQEITPDQAEQIAANPGAAQNFLESAVSGAKEMLLGGASMLLPGEYDRELARKELAPVQQEMQARGMQSPVSTLLGQAAPYVAADAAAVATGGVPLAVGVGALTGASGSPDDPLLGAALGAGGGLLAGAVPAAQRVLTNTDLGLPAIGNMTFPVPGVLGAGGQPRMAQRVMSQIDNAGGAGGAGGAGRVAGEAGEAQGRVWQGLMTADELDAMGVPLTNSQRMSLNAATDAEMNAARKMKWVEDIRGIDPAITGAQRQAFTSMVKSELGIAGPEALTDTVVGNALKQAGKEIGEITAARGPIPLGEDALTRIRGVVADADTTHAGALNNILTDLEAALKRGSGSVEPSDYQKILTRLNNMTKPGNAFGKLEDAGKILDELHTALEKGLAPAQKEALANARYRYKIGKTLSETGARGNDWNVNPVSFGSRWDKRISQTLRGQDTLGRAADTFSSLGRLEANAGTTLQRVFAKAPEVGRQTAVGAAASAIGFGGINSLFGP